jgi:hypothetical protein
MVDSLLKDRDYTVIVAKTVTNPVVPAPGFSERWTSAQESVVKLIQACQEFDPDGISLYVACRSPDETCLFKRYEQVTADKLIPLIEENFPPEFVNLKAVLETALDDYFARKAVGKTQANGEIILVLLDGEPSDRMAIVKTIIDASRKMDHPEELGIGLIQIGDDPIARGFFTALDDNLKDAGAAHDIVDFKVLADIHTDSLTDFLLDTLHD